MTLPPQVPPQSSCAGHTPLPHERTGLSGSSFQAPNLFRWRRGDGQVLEGHCLVGQGQKRRGQADKTLPLVRLVSFLGPTEQGMGGWKASLQGRGEHQRIGKGTE